MCLHFADPLLISCSVSNGRGQLCSCHSYCQFQPGVDVWVWVCKEVARGREREGEREICNVFVYLHAKVPGRCVSHYFT